MLSATSPPVGFSPEEERAVLAAAQAYVDAWMADDPEAAVMATFTRDATIIPSGMQPIRGAEAMRAFWFPPDSPPTVVTRFETSDDVITGHGVRAVVTGGFVLEFDYDGKSYANKGVYLKVVELQPDGKWLLSHHMWNDHR